MDTLTENKVGFAVEMAGICKSMKDYSCQANSLGYVYKNKKNPSNIDLFNWGLAHYNAQEYVHADSVFAKYTREYPENIYGYYWRAQANAAIDTSLSEGLAIPHYLKLIEVGEQNKEVNKQMLAKAYGYLGGYEANTKKDYKVSLEWFRKFLDIAPENEDAKRYVEILEGWVADGK